MLAKGTAGTGMEEICVRTLVMTSAISGCRLVEKVPHRANQWFQCFLPARLRMQFSYLEGVSVGREMLE